MSSATMQTINLNDKHGSRAISVGLFLRLILECMVIPTLMFCSRLLTANSLTKSVSAFQANPAPASNAGILTVAGLTCPGKDQSQTRIPKALQATAACTALFINEILSSEFPQALQVRQSKSLVSAHVTQINRRPVG